MSYDPSIDTANMQAQLDKYTHFTSSMFRPNVDQARAIAKDMIERWKRVKQFWDTYQPFEHIEEK